MAGERARRRCRPEPPRPCRPTAGRWSRPSCGCVRFRHGLRHVGGADRKIDADADAEQELAGEDEPRVRRDARKGPPRRRGSPCRPENARLRPNRSAARPPTAAPSTAPRTRAEPIRPTIAGAIVKSRVSSGSATPSEKIEKPSSKVPPLASSQRDSGRPIGASSRALKTEPSTTRFLEELGS